MQSSDVWHGLHRELDRWAIEGRAARFWLRDDDAVEPSTALDRLLEMTDRHRVPVLLAIVPLAATQALARRLERVVGVSPCQHGCAHRNHAPPDQKKEELGAHRSLAVVLDEVRRARDRLADLFGETIRPVLVPPWNRIARAVASGLPELGFEALSTFGRPTATTRIPHINCDIDIIDWKGGRRGHDPALLVSQLIEILADARSDGGRPVGILGHHLVHDAVAWSFLQELFTRTQSHPAAQWISFDVLSKS